MKVAVTKAAAAMNVAMVAARAAATARGAAAVARVVRIMAGRSKALAAIRMVGATRLAATRTADTISRVRIRVLAARRGRIKVVAARDQPGSTAMHPAQTRAASIAANKPRVWTCPQVATSIEATRPGLRVVCHRMTSAIASKAPKAMVQVVSVRNATVNAAAVADAGAVDAAVVAAAKAEIARAAPWGALRKAADPRTRLPRKPLRSRKGTAATNTAAAKAHPCVRASNRVMRARSQATRRRSSVSLLRASLRRSLVSHRNQRRQRANHSIRLSSGHHRLRRNTRIQPSRRDRASPALNSRSTLSRSRLRPTSSRHHGPQQHPRQHPPVVASRAAELSRLWSGRQPRLATRDAITSRRARTAGRDGSVQARRAFVLTCSKRPRAAASTRSNTSSKPFGPP